LRASDVIILENIVKTKNRQGLPAKSMGEEQEGGRKRGPADILPLFSPAFFDLWQIILPRSRLVIYVPERERDGPS
jgi:hypothetical protein